MGPRTLSPEPSFSDWGCLGNMLRPELHTPENSRGRWGAAWTGNFLRGSPGDSNVQQNLTSAVQEHPQAWEEGGDWGEFYAYICLSAFLCACLDFGRLAICHQGIRGGLHIGNPCF